MSARPENTAGTLQRSVAIASLGWMSAANMVGLWLALLLLFPEWGALTGSWSYGRWMPLHMDWQLYGWCSLPLLGLLFARFWENDREGPDVTHLALLLWSGALLMGGGSWLAGSAAAKPFLNWASHARWNLALTLLVIWGLVAWGGWRQLKRGKGRGAARWVGGGVLLGLLSVPVALFVTADASVYPPVDPDSGGATGHSLLASTLGLVALLGILPRWGLHLRTQEDRSPTRDYLYAFVFAGVLYLGIEHGNASNHAPNQILGLGSLLVWPFLIARHWGSYVWSPRSAGWRWAFLGWWSLLTLTGWISFLPPVLEILKFTNGMVAHAHLAMAGAVTSLHMVLLIEMGPDTSIRAVLDRPGLRHAWNVSLLLMLVALALQGVREGTEPEVLFRFDQGTAVLYAVRAASGAGLLLCGLLWTRLCLRREPLLQPVAHPQTASAQ